MLSRNSVLFLNRCTEFNRFLANISSVFKVNSKKNNKKNNNSRKYEEHELINNINVTGNIC